MPIIKLSWWKTLNSKLLLPTKPFSTLSITRLPNFSTRLLVHNVSTPPSQPRANSKHNLQSTTFTISPQPMIRKPQFLDQERKVKSSTSSQLHLLPPSTHQLCSMISSIMLQKQIRKPKDFHLPLAGKMSRAPRSFRKTQTQVLETTIQIQKKSWRTPFMGFLWLRTLDLSSQDRKQNQLWRSFQVLASTR